MVSIIIPVLNRFSFLPRLFTALEAQTFDCVEVIFVDNGSTDGSLALLSTWAADTRHKYPYRLLCEATPGPCAARNAGAQTAQGEWLYFFDSDDRIDADFLSDAMERDEAADLVCARTRMVFPNGKVKQRYSPFTHSPADQILTSMLSTQSFVVRRDFFVQSGGWDARLPRWNDWELGLRFLLMGARIVWLGRSYHAIYQHSDSISGGSLEKDHKALRLALRTARDEVEQAGLEERELTRARKALRAKGTMLAAELRRAGLSGQARETYRAARNIYNKGAMRAFTPLLYLYSRLGLPGAFRFFRRLLG